MSTLDIPSGVIPRLREGAQTQLCHAAEAIKAEVTAREKNGPPLEARAQTDRALALLDLLGWSGAVPSTVNVEVGEHATTLQDAIEMVFSSAMMPMRWRLAAAVSGLSLRMAPVTPSGAGP